MLARRGILIAAVVIALSGCGRSQPTSSPTPFIGPVQRTAAPTTVSAQAQPSDIVQPTTAPVPLTTDTLIARMTGSAAAATPTDTSSATNTLRPTETPPPTDTSLPTNTPRPTATRTPPPTTYYINAQSANARECPRTDCSRVTTFAYAEAIQVFRTVQGENTLGSADWREVLYDGQPVYIHSALTSLSRPAPVQVQATRPPSQQSQPTQPPVSVPTQPPAPPPASFVCDCNKACTAMVSCEEAYFQLQQCGCGRRDGDGDGVPCEDICPGG